MNITHPDEASILEYIADRATEEERIEIDAHIAECPECLDRIRALLYLRENFDSIWGAWTAAEHGRLYRQWELAVALRRIIEKFPSMADRARDWLILIKEGAGIAVLVMVDRTRRLAASCSGLLPEGYGHTLRLAGAGAGVGAPEEIAQAEGHLKRGSEYLSKGKAKIALGELEEAAKIDARLPQATVSEVYCQGSKVMEVIADSRRGYIMVKCWPGKERPMPDIVLLLPEGDPGSVLVASFVTVEGEEYLLAEFEDVPTGQFEVIAAAPCIS